MDDIILLDTNGDVLRNYDRINNNIDLHMVVDQISVTLDIVTIEKPLGHLHGLRDGYWYGDAEYIFNLSDGTQISCKSKLLWERGLVGGRLDWDIVPLPTNKKIIKAMIKILEDRGAESLPDGSTFYKKSDITGINSLYTTLHYNFGYLL